jgi:hypothetical protein
MKFLKKLLNDFGMIMGNEVGAFWIPMAIGAGLGALKNMDQADQVKRQNKAAAAQTEYSALTGSGPGQIQQAPSMFGDVLQGAATGAAFSSANPGMFGGGTASQYSQAANIPGQTGNMIGQQQGANSLYSGSYSPGRSKWSMMS